MKIGNMVVGKPSMSVTKEGDVKVRVVLEMLGDLSEGEVVMRELMPFVGEEVNVTMVPKQERLPLHGES